MTNTTHAGGREQLLTPSKITAWLDCAHFLTLQHEVEAGVRTHPKSIFGDMAQMLLDKGMRHEDECLTHYRAQGKTVHVVPTRVTNESFAAWVARIGNPMADGHDVIYQMPFVHRGVRGIADFLVRTHDPDTGESWYEPLDAKLARREAKPGHVLQLCFYADAIEALTGHAPRDMHIWLGSGDIETIRVRDVDAYWRRLQRQLEVVVTAEVPAHTEPVRCKHCDFCAFAPTCEQHWRDADALHYVAGLHTRDHDPLHAAGIATMAALGNHSQDAPTDVDADRFARLVRQARLQKLAVKDTPPPFEIIEPVDVPSVALGFAAMPQPDDGDVFLDYEGHPFWSAKEDLFFLFGLWLRGDDGTWYYDARWAHDKAQEREQTGALIQFFRQRRLQYSGMHVYHYNHTERSALERLARDHVIGEASLEELVETGLFVDLYPVVLQSIVVGAESYGLKHVEQLTGYERSHVIDKGAGAVVEFERFMADGDRDRLDRIARYNDDDVQATKALRDWLLQYRPADLPWRPATLEPDESTRPDIDDAATRLLERFPDEKSPEHLLGLLLGYWRREWSVVKADLMRRATAPLDDQLADPTVIAGLQVLQLTPRLGQKEQEITPVLELSFPPQTLLGDLQPQPGRKPAVLFAGIDGMTGYATIETLDAEAGRLGILWPQKAQELGVMPASVVLNDHVGAKPKPDALLALATDVLDGTAPNPVSMALLRRDAPAFTPGNGPIGGRFTDDVPALSALGLHLHESFLPIQGPPGTGKSYTGSQMVLALVKAGKRVGITSMSHHAIDNLMNGVVDAFTTAGELDRLCAIRRVPHAREADGQVTFTTDNGKCAKNEFNVVGGTTWLFSGKDMRENPVDVLFIDEAGQLSLADALAASGSARSIVLLGDPLQLPQVSQASHPGGSGASVLEHVLGEHRTIPDDRGAFLSTTRRMHPDVSTFISEQIYEGRLHTHPSCAVQNISLGTGLRWLRAEHVGRSTESPEESAMVVEALRSIIGAQFIDADGRPHTMTGADVMVVAPYNDQVRRLRADLDANPATASVKVGTVDKFQGQEAPVVFFTMTASSSADVSRGNDFLFSKNRLNVAVSRARALVYLVCTEALLDSRATDVDDMKLIATLCAFQENAQ